MLGSGMVTRLLCLLSLVGCLSACGTVDFDQTPQGGEFQSTLFVMWVDENETGAGDGRFVFVPSRTDPLRFRRDIAANPDATVEVITPGLMYTDGGSIPRLAQPFRGFSPWGYAPAYMVHDWLFVARRCLTDNEAEGNETDIADMSFQESAEVLAEAIRALIATNRVAPNDVAPRVISGVVAGPVSFQRWTLEGGCAEDRISAEHLAQIERAFPGTTQRTSRNFDPMIEILRDVPQGPVAQIVETISF